MAAIEFENETLLRTGTSAKPQSLQCGTIRPGFLTLNWRRLGFRRIAGSELIYRHSARKSHFLEEHPPGMDVSLDFEAEESDAKWVLRK